MLGPFFRVAMLSVGRQSVFRRAVVIHLLLLTLMIGMIFLQRSLGLVMLGQILLVAGIVEGAVLLGWRLSQLPRSQALEFLLVSALQPQRVFWAEATVGLCRLALVTLAGLPLLAGLVGPGFLDPLDLLVLLVVPFTWGAITGLGLTVWAYEAVRVRRWGERFVMASIVFYLLVGVLAGENLPIWLSGLPPATSTAIIDVLWKFHLYNPFGVMRSWMEGDPDMAWERTVGLEVCSLVVVGLLFFRGASRMKGHYHDRHYKPLLDPTERNRGRIGDRPLAWWAVKRVSEYSGRMNLWLAGGFGLVYAAYTMAGDAWPVWLGRRVFEIVALAGGIPVVATALAILAAVPAAFQYGLWDSNAQDRCRRLELLLLTGLAAEDYWGAAAAAAWRRGRGYFAVAVILWAAATYAGQMSVEQLLATLTASVLLWALYFTLGFRAFANGMQANGLGSLLTLGLPMLAVALSKSGVPALAALLPPGAVYHATVVGPTWLWLTSLLVCGLTTLLLAHTSLLHCDRDLRRWYDLNHGQKAVE